MCLAIPGQIQEIEEGTEPRMGKVSFGGITKQICLEWTPEAKEGDYVIVHVGFALSVLDEEEALDTLRLFDEINRAAGGQNPPGTN